MNIKISEEECNKKESKVHWNIGEDVKIEATKKVSSCSESSQIIPSSVFAEVEDVLDEPTTKIQIPVSVEEINNVFATPLLDSSGTTLGDLVLADAALSTNEEERFHDKLQHDLSPQISTSESEYDRKVSLFLLESLKLNEIFCRSPMITIPH